jgi:hypothetical protein
MKRYYLIGKPRRACPVLTEWPGSFTNKNVSIYYGLKKRVGKRGLSGGKLYLSRMLLSLGEDV